MADVSRGGYPPPTQDYNYQQSPARQEPPREDGRSSYPPPPDPSRQGQYPPPPDPSRQGQYPPAPQPYPPPQQWAGQPQGQPPYPQLPPPHHYDPQHAQYHYPPPPPAQPNQPPAPHDPYRLPPPPVYAAPYHYQYQAPPPPAPRQRTAIACKYCRKRKIRCSGYDSSPDGRCQNCVRFNQQCLFHPVSSQAAFVPASALYGPGARAPMAGGDNQGQNGQPQPMLYGAHGQPLGPAGPGGQPQYGYPPSAAATNTQPPPQPQGYAPPPYPGYPPNYGQPPPPVNAAPPASGPPPTAAPAPAPVSAPPPTHYDQSSQQAPPPTASSDRSDRGSLKRGPPDEDPHNETNGATHSPHPNARPRYDGRPSGSHDYQSPTSPANSTMSYQSYPPNTYSNGIQTQNINGNNSPPAGLTPNSIHSLHSPHSTNLENRTPPPPHPGSSGSSQNSRSGMRVHEMLGGPNHPQYNNEQRARNDSDNDMLSKLNGRK